MRVRSNDGMHGLFECGCIVSVRRRSSYIPQYGVDVMRRTGLYLALAPKEDGYLARNGWH